MLKFEVHFCNSYAILYKITILQIHKSGELWRIQTTVQRHVWAGNISKMMSDDSNFDEDRMTWNKNNESIESEKNTDGWSDNKSYFQQEKNKLTDVLCETIFSTRRWRQCSFSTV